MEFGRAIHDWNNRINNKPVFVSRTMELILTDGMPLHERIVADYHNSNAPCKVYFLFLRNPAISIIGKNLDQTCQNVIFIATHLAKGATDLSNSISDNATQRAEKS